MTPEQRLKLLDALDDLQFYTRLLTDQLKTHQAILKTAEKKLSQAEQDCKQIKTQCDVIQNMGK